MGRSTSASHDAMAAALAVPDPISNRDFQLLVDDLFGQPAGSTLPAQFGYSSNAPDAFTDVTVTVTDTGSLTFNNNPEVIGTIGAASAGFTNNLQIVYPASNGSTEITIALTGNLNGVPYIDTQTIQVSWAAIAFAGQG